MASEPRRLYRSSSDKMIAGVCGGLAQYFAMDPKLVRILTVVLGFMTGPAVVVGYVLLMAIVPEEPPS